MALTLSEITSLVYKSMGIPSTSTILDSATVVEPKIRNRNIDICSGYVTSVLDKNQTYKSPFLAFLQRNMFFQNPTTTTLTANAIV